MIALASKDREVAALGIANKRVPCTVDCPTGFDGSTNTTALDVTIVNPFYGPTILDLLEWGARIAPCMRQDSYIFAQFAAVRALECGISPNFCETGQWVDGVGYSCCQLVVPNRFGMTDKPTCDVNGGVWLDNGSNQSKLCDVSSNIVLRPCCLGYV